MGNDPLEHINNCHFDILYILTLHMYVCTYMRTCTAAPFTPNSQPTWLVRACRHLRRSRHSWAGQLILAPYSTVCTEVRTHILQFCSLGIQLFHLHCKTCFSFSQLHLLGGHNLCVPAQTTMQHSLTPLSACSALGWSQDYSTCECACARSVGGPVHEQHAQGSL